jgi:predicted nucleotidyltransferase
MNNTLYLEPNENLALHSLAQNLSQRLGQQLCYLWLFGSKSRGDFAPDSDIDILVVIDYLTPEIQHDVRQTAARISLNHDVLLNTHLLDKKRWDEISYHQATLWREIQKDGVSLLETASVL